MKRFIIIIIVLGVVLIGGSLLLKSCDSGNGQPSATSAKYEINADGRLYLTNDYTQGTDKYGQYVTLNGYWSYDGKYWKEVKRELYLSYRGYTSIKITNR